MRAAHRGGAAQKVVREIMSSEWYENYYKMRGAIFEEAELRGTRLVVQSLCGLGLVGRGPL
jgi:hypothetical protein